MSAYLLLAIGIGIGTLGQSLMKYYGDKTELTFGFDLVRQILTNIPLMLTFALYFLGAILWLFILKKLPLSIAYPALSLNYITVAIVSALVFHEPFTAGKVVALTLITTGVAVLFRFS